MEFAVISLNVIGDLEPIPKIDRDIARLFLILSDDVCLRVKNMLEQYTHSR